MNYQNIYILGGHKLSYSYYEKITQASDDGTLSFAHCQLIDADPDCYASDLVTHDSLIQKTNSEFILDYLKNDQNPQDILIPDHTAKHVMLQVYLDLAKKEFPDLNTAPAAIPLSLNTPFMHPSDDKSILAVSYATWTCPADCAEPAICPHTESERSWDFNKTFAEIADEIKSNKTALYRFACEPFLAEICHLPFKDIFSQTQSFIKSVKASTIQKVIVATHSHCHGILGSFSI